MRKKPVVIIVDSVYQKAAQIFNAVEDFQLVTGPEAEDALALQVTADTFGVVLGTERYTGPLYEKMRKGGILARFGVGCDGLDFKKAGSHDLLITNTPGVLDQTVAEYTVFLAAEVLRKVGQVSHRMKQETWKTFMGNDLQGKTWAIIGFGNIGKRLGRILGVGFGVRVLALDTNRFNEKELRADYGVDQLFTEYTGVVLKADIVSLHLPANAQTYHYLDKTRLVQINPGAILINTARGGLVDEGALYDALLNGHLTGAGLDVFETEPYVPVTPDKDLRKLSSVVLSPHLASSTVECCNRMAQSVMANLRHAVEGKFNQMNLVR